jgi:hypothetical protein
MQRVLGVAKVDPFQVVGDASLDVAVVHPTFDCLRSPRPGAIGVVVVLWKGGHSPTNDFNVHFLTLQYKE